MFEQLLIYVWHENAALLKIIYQTTALHELSFSPKNYAISNFYNTFGFRRRSELGRRRRAKILRPFSAESPPVGCTIKPLNAETQRRDKYKHTV